MNPPSRSSASPHSPRPIWYSTHKRVQHWHQPNKREETTTEKRITVQFSRSSMIFLFYSLFVDAVVSRIFFLWAQFSFSSRSFVFFFIAVVSSLFSFFCQNGFARVRFSTMRRRSRLPLAYLKKNGDKVSIRHWQCISFVFSTFFSHPLALCLSALTFGIYLLHDMNCFRVLCVLVSIRLSFDFFFSRLQFCLSATRARHFTYQNAPLVSFKLNSTD